MPDPEENVPTYQYACTACGHQLEAVQSFADEPLTECPACAGRLRKLFNSVGIVFKGSGFYRTDSRASGSDSLTGGKSNKSDSSSGGSSGGDSGSSSSSSSSSSSASSSSSSAGSGSGSGSSSGGSSTTKAPAASSS
ncbi:FmdB family zinc ribbon protein [Micromonospora cathayae]|uniref:Zinc ribbon domain-containing protein n=1 Tax=Micromonospora cathayae TaxID=3028804 RepID=A0ABY7ZXT1_9ACTN|nr:FmdB family zinc ribbon protein [Micromonospora sp. HUAS 3]WDZ86684.1 zinc ribbon domain-containing protein [Micromonospora sp. HUAS 3]